MNEIWRVIVCDNGVCETVYEWPAIDGWVASGPYMREATEIARILRDHGYDAYAVA